MHGLLLRLPGFLALLVLLFGGLGLVPVTGQAHGGGCSRDGNIAMPFSTAGMCRAYVDTDGDIAVRLFGQNGGE